MNRRDELRANLADIRERVASACHNAGRNPDEVTIIVVTKTWPASDIQILGELGVTDVGENRDQEASAKHAELLNSQLVWHAIGQIQTNKAKSVAKWADVVHSVDRPELVQSLAKASESRKARLRVLIQVNLDPEPSDVRGGCGPEEMLALAQLIATQPMLQLAGVMGVAPLNGDAALAFSVLKQQSNVLQSQYPDATWISAGMSDDFEKAIKMGATHLRIGSMILGHRPANR